MHTIDQATSAENIEAARSLFREYETWLGMSLCFQDFERELRELPGKYAPPDGRLYIVTIDAIPSGCIALRKFDNDICEMKRLYLNENTRGRGIGKDLIQMLIADARNIGYKQMRLDTYPPKMGKAVKLYESHGFRPIPKYYDNPHEGVLFMELDL